MAIRKHDVVTDTVLPVPPTFLNHSYYLEVMGSIPRTRKYQIYLILNDFHATVDFDYKIGLQFCASLMCSCSYGFHSSASKFKAGLIKPTMHQLDTVSTACWIHGSLSSSVNSLVANSAYHPRTLSCMLR